MFATMYYLNQAYFEVIWLNSLTFNLAHRLYILALTVAVRLQPNMRETSPNISPFPSYFDVFFFGAGLLTG